jgi:hypothetical protein
MRRAILGWAALAVLVVGLIVVAVVEGTTPTLSDRAGGPGFPGSPGGGGVGAPTALRESGPPPRPPRPPQPSPTAPLVVPVNIDGCDHSYGRPGQCVPWTFPAGVRNKCAWLRQHGYGRLAVVGTDRLRLDSNRDKVACGPGDH